MGGHRQNGHGSGHGGLGGFGRGSGLAGLGRGDRLAGRRLGPGLVIAALAAWSLLAWVGYVSVDAVLGWIAASAGAAAETGRALAEVAGAGEAVAVVDGLNADGVLGGILGLVQAVAKPVIVVIWAAGAVAILVLPRLLSAAGRAVGTGRR